MPMSTIKSANSWFGELKPRENRLHVEKFEPLSFADKRIVLGPRIGQLTLDYAPRKLLPQLFQIGYSLVESVDTPVTYTELIRQVWGWDQPDPDPRMTIRLHESIASIRSVLGEELGDAEYGAIRSVYGVGYVALSEL